MDALLSMDRALFQILNGQPWPAWLDAFFVLITRDATWRLPLLLLWLYLLLGRGPVWRRRALWLVPLIALSDSLNSQILKELFGRPRPCHETIEGLRLLVHCGAGKSFPSSHAANMGAAGVFLAAGVIRKRARAAILILPFLVAYSRIHVGVHYPLDVLVGFGVGALLAWGMLALMKRVPWRRLGLKREDASARAPSGS